MTPPTKALRAAITWRSLVAPALLLALFVGTSAYLWATMPSEAELVGEGR